MSNMKVLLIA